MKARSLLLLMAFASVGSRAKVDAKDTRKVAPQASFVRTYLAGTRLSLMQPDFTAFDAKAGYYLVKFGDTFDVRGATLILSPDLAATYWPRSSKMSKSGIIRKTLPRLHTGTGVNIGDTPLQVRRKLGAWPREIRRDNGKIRFYGYHSHVLVDMPYATGQWTNGERIVDRQAPTTKSRFHYYALYWFRNEKLESIEYTVTYLAEEP